jgi:hypothetical protein
MPNWMCLMRAGMRSTTCCLAEVRVASMLAPGCVCLESVVSCYRTSSEVARIVGAP